MKTGMMKQATALLAIGAAALFTSCAPQSQSGNSSYLESQTSQYSGILGGVLADSKFQQANGIVQLKIISVFGEATCTGSLIARNIVLTAAHCIADEGLRGVAVILSTSDSGATKEQVIYATRGTAHEGFAPSDADGVWNDIALLKLEKDAPVEFQLAKLPSAADSVHLDKNSKLTLAGYGITNAVVRKVVKDKKGKDVVLELPSRGSGTLRKVSNIPVTEVTADQKEISLDQTNLRGACHGDSGGPALLRQADGSFVQVGVTSRGTEKLGNCTKGAIYTGLAGHLEWITLAVEQLSKEEPVATAAK